jgi:hypothetical protein
MADNCMKEAERIAYGAYGSHDLTRLIRCIRHYLRFGDAQYKADPDVASILIQLIPPYGPKVSRMFDKWPSNPVFNIPSGLKERWRKNVEGSKKKGRVK